MWARNLITQLYRDYLLEMADRRGRRRSMGQDEREEQGGATD